jgi:hypothetical protein
MESVEVLGTVRIVNLVTGDVMMASAKVRIVCGMSIALTLVGCVSSGAIVKVTSDREAEVVVKEDFVKAGDRVSFFKTECDSPTVAKYRRCRESKIGEGVVTSRSGDKATVKADTPLDLSASNYVGWSYSR